MFIFIVLQAETGDVWESDALSVVVKVRLLARGLAVCIASCLPLTTEALTSECL